eukprot:TRINITY_DN12163_c0_g1_i1.p1 TRINITY_DN12163_c0_g1~~TRINITY_DN12163_c0_g1_i1.p1  ORF type:complete len:590 (-),score=119.02 TRINITY_DN12163_c0_g1_i1:81-1850(-)
MRKLLYVVLLVSVIAFSYVYYHTIDPYASQILDEEYDYIVVGAGTSGCVVASRLSQHAKVLLVEAGKSDQIIENWSIKVPLFTVLNQKSSMDWKYQTVSQLYSSKDMNQEKSNWPRGKILGGSGQLNYMHYVRGNKQDYDHWSELGNPGWDYQSLLPLFKKSQTVLDDTVDERYHGKSGPLQVRPVSTIVDNVKLLFEALKKAGFDPIDYNGENQLGFGYNQATVNRNGKRSSTADYLSIGDQLTISTQSMVTKISFAGTNRAEGVYITRQDGSKLYIKAKKEIILSAGSINTPQLLQLSGIGPQELLTKLNIPLVKDLPVGKNLLDHLMFSMPFAVNATCISDTELLSNPKHLFQYLTSGTGAISSSGLDATGFIQTGLSDLGGKPDIQYMIVSGAGDPSLYGEIMNFRTDKLDNLTQCFKGPHQGCLFILPTLLHPKSTGKIEIVSTDPFEPPLIDPNYYSSPIDIDIHAEGCYWFWENIYLKTQFRHQAYYEIDQELLNECNGNMRLYFKKLLVRKSVTCYHPVGTAKMGPVSDHHSVVDSNLKIHGIEKLRVADGSIMPTLTSGNTNAPCVVIGEKAAELILGDL